MAYWDKCSVKGCGRPTKAKKLCRVHYDRARLGRPLTVPIAQPVHGTPAYLEACSQPGCRRPRHAVGLCATHYQQLRKGKQLSRVMGHARRGARADRSKLVVGGLLLKVSDATMAHLRGDPDNFEAIKRFVCEMLEAWARVNPAPPDTPPPKRPHHCLSTDAVRALDAKAAELQLSRSALVSEMFELWSIYTDGDKAGELSTPRPKDVEYLLYTHHKPSESAEAYRERRQTLRYGARSPLRPGSVRRRGRSSWPPCPCGRVAVTRCAYCLRPICSAHARETRTRARRLRCSPTCEALALGATPVSQPRVS